MSCGLRLPRPTPIPPLGTAAPSPLVPGVPQKVLRGAGFDFGLVFHGIRGIGFRLAGPCYEVDRHAAVFNSDTQCLLMCLSFLISFQCHCPNHGVTETKAERYMGRKHWLQVGPILRELWHLILSFQSDKRPSRTV